ncbi:hypothetical protein NEMIN01_1181 [Nematocida minor]|uniref:uncharacterized protein n=1 Tax=Nematocida minor TaxID=1912983 RepID=UPI002220DE62|nr:uncharacterized protein NEMIN01_1181 [Nematocida minor]KAI5190716.1 hypothetical protein NEMIN01_1181 [Nematocida minor]
MFTGPARSINEKEFCEEYRRADKKFNDSPNYSTAESLLRLNSEDYMAYYILRSTLTIMNHSSQISLTEEIIDRNPSSYCAWMHRMYLMKRVDLMSGSGDTVQSSDISFLHKVLQTDNRNIHAWTYISAVYRFSRKIVKNEISKSISNYSAYFAAIENGMYESIEESDLKNIIFTDPDISSPWVFIRMKEEVRRMNGKNAYVKKYSNRLNIFLKVPGRTKVKIVYNGKTVVYTADFKKSFSIYFNKKEEFEFGAIESIKIKTKTMEDVEINLKKEVPVETPAVVDAILEKYPTVQGYITKLFFTADEEKREVIIKTAVKLEPKREQIFSDLREGFSIYGCM